jgi:Coenzyme PQQ synthesis protein D (PqqD)
MEAPTIPISATVVASTRQVSTDVEGESVILNFDEGIYYGLEKVGARVWELARTPTSVAEIRDTLIAEFDVEPERCQRDLQDLLSELAEAGLIEVADAGAS